MKQKVMDAMQSFSKALMGPVLFLPIAGMLQAISSVMSNTALVTEGGVVWTLGKFINGGVSAVIGNLGILFCVGIASITFCFIGVLLTFHESLFSNCLFVSGVHLTVSMA